MSGNSLPSDLFRQLVESVSAVTYVLRLGRAEEPPVYMSPQCEAVVGLPRDVLMVDARARNQLLHPEDRARVWDRAHEIDTNGGDWDMEYRLRMPDGSYRWIHDQARVIPGADGPDALWFGVLTDLTRTSDAERALADSEAKYRALVEQMPAVVYIDTYEEHPRSLYVSPQTEHVSGYRPQEWIADPGLWLKIIHPDDRQIVQSDWPVRIDDPGIASVEYRIIHRDGHVVWVRDTARLVRAGDGTPLFCQGVILDVTDTKLTEQDLRTSELKYRTLVEQVPAVVFIESHSEAPVCLYVSPQATAMLGAPPERFVEDPSLFLRTIHPEDRERVGSAWADAVRHRDSFLCDFRAIRPDGSVLSLREAATLIRDWAGNPLYWQGLLQDLTDIRRAEVEVRDSETRYRVLVEQVPAVVYIDSNDVHPSSLYLSPQVVELLGHAPDEFMAQSDFWEKTIHPQDWDRVQARWRESVLTGAPFRDEYRFVRADGEVVWVTDDSRLVRAPDGTPLYWQGVLQDVTEHRRAEEELRAVDARFRGLVEQMPAVVYEMGLDDERRTLYVNPQVEALFGYSRQEWLDQPDIWMELLHPDDREVELAAHDLHNETGEPWIQEYRLIANDGRVVWVRDQAALVRDQQGLAHTWQGVMLDITAQKELEERLRLTNEDLETRVSLRTAELAEANEMMTLEIGERRRVESELRETQERYRRLVEDMPAVIYVWHAGSPAPHDPQDYTSPQIERLLGYTAAEWSTTFLWRDRIHPHDADRIMAASARSEETGEPFEEKYRLLAKDGHVVWVADHAALLSRNEKGQPKLFQGVLLDITARMQAEAAEEQFRELLDSSPAMTYVFEATFGEPPVRMLQVSSQVAEFIGYPPEQLLSDIDLWTHHVHPDDREWLTRDALIAFRTGEPWQRVFRVIHGDGRIAWVLSAGRCVQRDEIGRPLRFVGVQIDLTEHMEGDDRATAQLAQLGSLVEGIPGMPWIEVVEGEPGSGRLVFIGPQVQTILGYTPAELLSEPRYVGRIVHPDDQKRHQESSERHDRTGEPWSLDYRAITRDGRIRWLRSHGRATRDGRGRLTWYGVTDDVTDEITDATIMIPEVAPVDRQRDP